MADHTDPRCWSAPNCGAIGAILLAPAVAFCLGRGTIAINADGMTLMDDLRLMALWAGETRVMVRKLLLIGLLAATAVGAYVAAPLITAWQIREAVRLGDTARLRDKVDWPSVRQSLKSSLGEARQALGELSDAAGEPRPGLWQRIKAAALPYVTDPLIDRYVTAEGAPKLYKWRQALRQRLQQASAAAAPRALASTSSGWLDGTSLGRSLALARRIERWSFVSPMRLEIELADRQVAGRRWFAALEMRALSWRLTEMSVVPAGSSGDRAAAGSAGPKGVS